MAKKNMGIMSIIPLGKKRAVGLLQLSDGSFCLELRKPISKKSDLKDGKPVPLATTVRQKNQLITQIRFSKEAALALKVLIDKLVIYPSLFERFKENFINHSLQMVYSIVAMEKR
ncbi:MAG: hypothetical protein Q8L47_02720 [bacterium]|nr:hypothetical protein [bacterium]